MLRYIVAYLPVDVSGVFLWFWSRPDIPESIKSATATSHMDVSTWGMPSASYPASGCNITEFFPPQKLVLLITLCGEWAGVPNIYSSTCPGSCISNIIGSGSPVYDEAYWEIPYIRTYIAEDLATPPTVSSSSSPQPNSPTNNPVNPVNPASSGSVTESSEAPGASAPTSGAMSVSVSIVWIMLSMAFGARMAGFRGRLV